MIVAPTLNPFEIATGLVFGNEASPRRRAAHGTDPLEALGEAIRPALLRPPCLVTFSGGRDSSSVLAVATHLARREGLPLPIPATNIFPEVGSSDESVWQEQVIRALELDDWIRLEHIDELDCVGPVAARILKRHGVRSSAPG